MLSTYLRAVGACKSWDSGNILAQVLPSIERLTDNQIDELVTAFNENVELGAVLVFVARRRMNTGLVWCRILTDWEPANSGVRPVILNKSLKFLNDVLASEVLTG